ncbi:CBS domain-containing protein [Actinomadura barringtoniae]|uniref:CBS domain-containing protein n=1 Tax=Actinomadura barringtoniae TaxID=1427535 RepID=A0A939PDZ9_9ACTN|nr:CBS domain-containing protein [Actinomadura barringtoniae]MBO2447944.1 CBS domain-containing protein [Actinomadura barringtoniae]
MTSDVATVQADATFRDIVAMLEKRRISGLPVIDGGRRVLGVVSESDLLVKEAAEPLPGESPYAEHQAVWRGRRHRLENARARGGTAGEIMSTPAVTIAAGATIIEAARLLTRHGVNRLPVVDADGRLAGIVSRADLLRVFTKPDEVIRRQVIEEVIQRSLWQDPGKVEVEVRDGVVTLRGQLDVSSNVTLATQLTEAIDSVVAVHNELTFEHDDIKHKIDPQSLRHRDR